MTTAPERLRLIYGTEEPPPERRILRAGRLEALLEAGALRRIRIDGLEALRGLAFLVRDRNWGTALPEISGLSVEEGPEGFRVSYRALCREGAEEVAYAARIEGRADGSLLFEVEGSSETGFLTNRTGFTILHPGEGLEGRPLEIGQTDGTVERMAFPDRIRPDQPAFDIATMRWSPAPGLTVTVRTDDDAYEMEDQRNWSDASFKTYYRPLAKPRPYRLEPGQPIRQSVRIEAEGRAEAVAPKAAGAAKGRLPALSLLLDPDEAPPVAAWAGPIAGAGFDALLCHLDPGRGHGAEAMRRFAEAQEATGLPLELEAVLPLRGPDGEWSADLGLLARTLGEIAALAGEAGLRFRRVMALPDCYRRSWQPDETWPAAPPLEAVVEAARAAFPGAEIGGGMLSYFTELNRKPPPQNADFVTHGVCPIVHAGDDLTVVENLGALGPIAASARALMPGRPYRVGPTGIAMRQNPYGAAPAPNPDGRRLAMAEEDPRMAGLFGAAWALAVVGEFARGGAEGLCLGSLGGGNSVVEPDGRPRPILAVLRALAGLAGREVSPPPFAATQTLRGFAVAGGGTWAANLSEEEAEATHPGGPLRLGAFEVVRVGP